MERGFLRWPGFKRKAITLSYDDAVIFDKRLIEIMDKYGLKGTFNINSGVFSTGEGTRRLTKQAAYSLYANSNDTFTSSSKKKLMIYPPLLLYIGTSLYLFFVP